MRKITNVGPFVLKGGGMRDRKIADVFGELSFRFGIGGNIE